MNFILDAVEQLDLRSARGNEWRTSPRRSVADLEVKAPEVPPPAANLGARMRYRPKTTAGKDLYKLRQETVGFFS